MYILFLFITGLNWDQDYFIIIKRLFLYIICFTTLLLGYSGYAPEIYTFSQFS